jgi:hypothetical protein
MRRRSGYDDRNRVTAVAEQLYPKKTHATRFGDDFWKPAPMLRVERELDHADDGVSCAQIGHAGLRL